MKSTLKGHRFDTCDEIKKNSQKELFAIPKEAFQKAFQSWKERWERCVASKGNYFEGDKLEQVVSAKIKFLLQQSGLFFDHTSYMVQKQLILLTDLEKTHCAKESSFVS